MNVINNENKQIYPVFAIRDAVSGTFGQLMIESNEQTARRNFKFGCRDGLMDYSRSDFSLYLIGHYDVCSGVFIQDSIPTMVCQASDFAD